MKNKVPLLRDMLVVQEGLAEKCEVQDAMREVKKGVVPSSLEIVKDMSGEEEPGDDEGAGQRVKLFLRPQPLQYGKSAWLWLRI